MCNDSFVTILLYLYGVNIMQNSFCTHMIIIKKSLNIHTSIFITI